VTGATGGIGRALVPLYAPTSALFLTGRDPVKLDEVAHEARSLGSEVSALALDLVAPGAVQTLASWLGGPVDVLVNNAGDVQFGLYESLAWSVAQRDLRLNLEVPMELVHALLPAMLSKGQGRIVNVLSIAAKETFAGAAAYSAAKAGLLAFTRCLNRETRTRGVHSVALLPGATDTALWDRQQGCPPRDKMLPAIAVAEEIARLTDLPADRAVDEVVLLPPHGVL
jgi:short-subunit dehydrogenase